MTQIYHAHLYGTRTSKYDWLQGHDVLSTDWQGLKPQAPFYLLIPQNTDLLGEYEQGWKITDVMPVNSTGVKTHRDHFVFDFDYSSLRSRIEAFRNSEILDEELAETYNLHDTRDWKITSSRISSASNDAWKNAFTKCLYRPFDWREYYHHKDVVELPRSEVMRNILEENAIGLCTTRQVNGDFMHTLCTAYPVTDCTISVATKERTYLFPLYIYSSVTGQEQLVIQKGRSPNFSQVFLNAVADSLGYTPTAEAIFFYIYALFHSPKYRIRYGEFLKNDFPRVFITSDNSLFQALSEIGKELVDLHLLKSPRTDSFNTEFIGVEQDRKIDAGYPKYDESSNSILINKRGSKFIGVPQRIWNFYIGGYQVCQKWLKDRKGRTLSQKDITHYQRIVVTHYQRIVVALQETIRLMQQIDAAIPGWPLE